MSEGKAYTIFVKEGDVDKFRDQKEKIFKETLLDSVTREQFEAEVMVSQSSDEGYDKLLLQVRGGVVPGDWFVKIVAREEDEEEEVTIFESKRLGERRGYMLRSMMSESDRSASRKDIMTQELQKRLKQKQKIISDMKKNS